MPPLLLPRPRVQQRPGEPPCACAAAPTTSRPAPDLASGARPAGPGEAQHDEPWPELTHVDPARLSREQVSVTPTAGGTALGLDRLVWDAA